MQTIFSQPVELQKKQVWYKNEKSLTQTFLTPKLNDNLHQCDPIGQLNSRFANVIHSVLNDILKKIKKSVVTQFHRLGTDTSDDTFEKAITQEWCQT